MKSRQMERSRKQMSSNAFENKIINKLFVYKSYILFGVK